MAAAEQELVVVRGLEGVDGCLIILGIFFRFTAAAARAPLHALY
jgi:uncharacterized protein YbjT (DUF2867 family)